MNGVFEVKDKAFLSKIKEESAYAATSLCKVAKLKKGDIFVIGCSSSEILGEKIGTNSSVDVAKAVFEGIYPVLKKEGLYMAVQCCEHLNRSIIIEGKAAESYRYPIVNVKPQPKAGGSLGTIAFESFEDAVAVEHIEAAAGIDIGLTMIGMHLRPVAVPVRLDIKKIGNAPIVCARTRPKFVGGSRAFYNEDLL